MACEKKKDIPIAFLLRLFPCSPSSSRQEQEWCHGTGCFGLLGLPPLVCFFVLLSCGFMHPARDENDEKTAGSVLVVVVGWKG